MNHHACACGAALALAALLAAGPAHAQGGLGRLFTTPIERMQLDSQRNGSPAGLPGQNTAIAAPAAAPLPEQPLAVAPEPVQLNGVVRRSSGRSTVWLNQVPQADANNQLLPDQSLSLRLSSGRKLIMKPGQSFDPANGSVREAAGR